jgi:type I restriction enzyme S subunit
MGRSNDSTTNFVPLRDICARITKGTTPTTLGRPFVERGVNFVKSEAITPDGRIDSSTFAAIDPETHAMLARSVLEEGDVLFSMAGVYLWKTAVVSRAILPANTNQAVGIIRLDRSKVEPQFIHYALSSPLVRDYVRRSVAQSAQPNYNLGDIGLLPIPNYGLREQRAVAHILGTLDDKIELNRKMNETLEAMVRALFKSWFVDFDPVRAKAEGRQPSGMDAETAKLFPSEFVDSELGPIPKGWRVARLVELTKKIGSGATPRGGDKAYVEDGISFIRSQNVYDSIFVWDGLVRLIDEDAARLAGVTVERDDILLNITGASILRTCVVDPAVLPARVNQHVAIVRAQDRFPSRYVHNHLLRQSTKDYLLGMDAGASRQAVTKGHIESIPIVQPPEPILRTWQCAVASLYERMHLLTSETQSLAAIRDSLLPKLLSGALRSLEN